MHRIGTRLFALVIVALCAMIAPKPAHAVRTSMNIDTLRGISGVHVVIQKIDEDLAKNGLVQDSVQTAVEQRLQANGIKILTEDELGKENGAILFIALDAVKSDGSGVYACNINMELIQVASLSRDPDTLIPASTWTTGMVALVSASNMKHLRDMTLEVVDRFAKDYKTANTSNKSDNSPEVDVKHM